MYRASEEQTLADIDAEEMLPWTDFYWRMECGVGGE
jgi:hypothetical protein